MLGSHFKLALDHMLKSGRATIGELTDTLRELESRSNSTSSKRAFVGKVIFRALRFGRRQRRHSVSSMASCQSYQEHDLFRSGFIEDDLFDEDDPSSDRGPLVVRNPGPADSPTSDVGCCPLDENTGEESITLQTSRFSLSFEGGQDKIADNFGSQFDGFNSQSDDFDSQSEDLGSQPNAFGSQPDDFDSQFDDFSSQFDDAGSQPDDLDSKSDEDGCKSYCDRALAQLRYCLSLNGAGSHSTVIDPAEESNTEHRSQSMFQPVPFELLTTTNAPSTNTLFARKPVPTNNLPPAFLRSLDTYKEVVVDTLDIQAREPIKLSTRPSQ